MLRQSDPLIFQIKVNFSELSHYKQTHQLITMDRQSKRHICLSPQSGSLLAPSLFYRISGDQKPLVIENYTLLSKRNNPMERITILATWQILFFCDYYT